MRSAACRFVIRFAGVAAIACVAVPAAARQALAVDEPNHGFTIGVDAEKRLKEYMKDAAFRAAVLARTISAQ